MCVGDGVRPAKVCGRAMTKLKSAQSKGGVLEDHMNKLVLTIVAVFAFISLVGIGSAFAQRSQRLRSTPRQFQTFFAAFTKAVAKGDKNTVATMTQFPFDYGWDAGDEGTYTKAEFLKSFDNIFQETTDLFLQKNPIFFVENGRYSLTNEEVAAHYIFAKKAGRYKFVTFVVEP